MSRFETEITIDSPAADVFAILANPQRQTEWMEAIKEVEVHDDAPGAGTRYTSVHVDHGHRVELDNTITAYEHPGALAIKHVMPGTDMLSTYTLKEHEGHTHLHVAMTTQPNNVGQRPPLVARLFAGLLSPLVNAQVRKQMAADMQRLKALAEQG